MLPILRTISVGGVLLAITILALALSPPGRSHVALSQKEFASVERPAGGALIDRGDHPEWRQFLILAALRRADEINRLRDLPDSPTRLPEIPDITPEYLPVELPLTPPESSPDSAAPKFAGLPKAHKEIDDGDETGSINAPPDATMTIEIGEPSSTELPVGHTEERPPIKYTPSASAPTIDVPATETSNEDEPSDPIVLPKAAPRVAPILALAPVERADPIVVVVHKHSARHRAAKPTPAPATAPAQIKLPPPFNFFQMLFASFARKPDEPSPKTVSRTVRKKVARPVPGHVGKQADNARRRSLPSRP